jgi:hypothetical protein
MGIQSTRYITREAAIERIFVILLMATNNKFREIESVTNENDNQDGWCWPIWEIEEKLWSVYPHLKDVPLEDWLDTMLSDVMDKPYFRHSIFENYIINETGEDHHG